MTGDGYCVDGRDVDRGARRVLGDVARAREVRVTASERRDRRLQAGDLEELEHREHAPVDLSGFDVLPPARVDLDAFIREHLLLELLLGLQQHLAGARRARGERLGAVGAEDGAVLERDPAVEDRLRVDQRRTRSGGPDLEEHPLRLRRRAGCGMPAARTRAGEMAEDCARDDRNAHVQRPQVDVIGAHAGDAPRPSRGLEPCSSLRRCPRAEHVLAIGERLRRARQQ